MGAAWPLWEQQMARDKILWAEHESSWCHHAYRAIAGGKPPIPPWVSIEFFSCVQIFQHCHRCAHFVTCFSANSTDPSGPQAWSGSNSLAFQKASKLRCFDTDSIPLTFCSVPQSCHNWSLAGKHNYLHCLMPGETCQAGEEMNQNELKLICWELMRKTHAAARINE